MQMGEDIVRIGTVLRNRMARGWLDGDPESLIIRPLATANRWYVIQYENEDGRQFWEVDASKPGIVLVPAGRPRGSTDRSDHHVSNIVRVIKSHHAEDTKRAQLGHYRSVAEREGFDFLTLFQLAARVLGNTDLDMEEVMTGGEVVEMARAA